jgi:DNA ligase 1
MAKTFLKLFKKSSTGAIQTWSISVSGSDITVNHGQLDGAIQTATETIKSGKNQGKANETTPEAQALAEAQSKWLKQKKKGYVEDLQTAEKGQVDKSVIAGGVDPMLAHKYKDHAHKIEFPCYGQPKLDGVRCISVIEPNGNVTLWSRTRKFITSVPHINKELSKLADQETIILDGELYVNKYKNDFEKIISMVRQQEPAPGHEVIQYHVYDMVMDGPFLIRKATFQALLQQINNSVVVPVETVILHDTEELDSAFSSFVEEGYEGLMVRNVQGTYEHKRSYNLQKVKEMQDEEFVVIDVESGRGKREGQAVLVCQNKAGQVFRASPKGTDQYRKELLKNKTRVIGKMVTIQYQNLTALGVPRFGVAKCIRDYE